MYTAFFPQQDPCFHFVSKIESVPVPWSFIGNNEEKTLGFSIKIDRSCNKAVVVNKDAASRAKVIDGDVIIKAGAARIADDDGSLLDPKMTPSSIAEEIKSKNSKEVMLRMDVLRSYHAERLARCTKYPVP